MPSIKDPLHIGTFEVKNRLYRAPVLEGAATKEEMAREYLFAFEKNARAGIGLIIQGNSVVIPDGNTAPGMICVEERDTMLALAPVPKKLHEYGTRIVIQLGHGGIYALQSWSRKARRAAKHPLLAPSPLPGWLRLIHPGVHVLTTEEVFELADRFGRAAKWAREAGYDGAQLASSNAKLLHQFLTPFYNRRTDEFGGSVEKRFRLMALIRERIASEAGADFPVLVKVPFFDHPRGITLEAGLEMCRLAERAGFAAVTPVHASHLPSTSICRGAFPGEAYKTDRFVREYLDHTESRMTYQLLRISNWLTSKKFPFSPVWNRNVFARVKREVGIPVFAVGGIRSLGEIESILSGGEADMVGMGRPLYAEPFLPARILAGHREPAACENANRCIPPQMLGYRGTCFNPSAQEKRSRLEKSVPIS